MAGRIVPRLGHRRVAEINRRDVAKLIRDLQVSGLAGWTIRGTLVPLGVFMEWAEDEGLRRGNPVRELRKRERPKVTKREHRNLTETDLWRLVDAATDERRAFVALLAFAGLRLAEACGLTWADVDLDGRVLHVRKQLERGTDRRVEPKTERARREVELDDGLVSILRAGRLRSRHSGRSDFVVVTTAGTPFDHRGAARRLDTVVRAAGLDTEGEPKITPHQLRYSFGALLLDAAVPVAVVSRMMGHANEAITQSIYSHEIQRRDSGERTRAAMREAFGRHASRDRVVASR
jgi:integrase